MKTARLESMKRGWYIGDFEPSLLKTKDFEASVKVYRAGDYGESHHHKIATEYTVVISGRIRMFDREFTGGDILVVEPGDISSLEALEDSGLSVIKIPCAHDDKYYQEEVERDD